MMRNSFIATVAVLSIIVLGVSSCSYSADSDTTEHSRTQPESSFTGEYSTELYTLYKSVEDDNLASLIADGDISEQDISDVQNAFSKCMSEYGWDITFRSDGGMDIASVERSLNFDNEKESKDESTCESKTSSSQFQKLYNSIHNNVPKFKSENEANQARIVCLKRKGIVPDDYTLDDYNYDWGYTSPDKKPHGALEKYITNFSAHDTQSELFWGCQNNPNS